MEKTLTFTVEGKTYTLAFTRDTIIATENMGFDLGAILQKPVSSLTYLWRGALLEHHDTLTIAESDKLFEKIDKKGLLDALIDLYNAPVESLMDEEHEKNAIKWTVN